MFAKSVITSDKFLDMPHSAQCLYFHLCMEADDDGFVNNPNTVARMSGCKGEDMALLIKNGYVIPFEESGLAVIRHFKTMNYIQKDCYKPTKYHAERQKLVLDSKTQTYEFAPDSENPEQISVFGDLPQDETTSEPPHDKNTVIITYEQAVEKIYNAYPEKKGKAKGVEYVLGFLKNGRKIAGYGTVKLNHEQLYCAVRAYAIECKHNDRTGEFVKMFSTFMNKPVLDYWQEAQDGGGYEEYMQRIYGNEWKSIRFKYTERP